MSTHPHPLTIPLNQPLVPPTGGQMSMDQARNLIRSPQFRAWPAAAQANFLRLHFQPFAQLPAPEQQRFIDRYVRGPLPPKPPEMPSISSLIGGPEGAGGALGAVVGGLLAPESGGLSLLVPVAGAALGGAAGSELHQATSGNRETVGQNLKQAGEAGATQGALELVSGLLSPLLSRTLGGAFRGRVVGPLLRHAVGVRTAEDQAVKDISDKYGLGLGLNDITGRLKSLSTMFGSGGAPQRIRKAGVEAAQSLISRLGPAAETTDTRDALRAVTAQAERAFNSGADRLFSVARKLNAGREVDLSSLAPDLERGRQGVAFGSQVGLRGTPTAKRVAGVAGLLRDAIDEDAAARIEPQADALRKSVAALEAIGPDQFMPGASADLKAAANELQSGRADAYAQAAASVERIASAVSGRLPNLPETATAIRAADALGAAARNVLDHPSLSFARADKVLQDLREFRPEADDPNPAMTRRFAAKLSQHLYGAIDKATGPGSEGNSAWRAARSFYHGAGEFREGIAAEILARRSQDIGREIAEQKVSDEDLRSFFGALDHLRRAGLDHEADQAMSRIRRGVVQSLVGDTQGRGLDVGELAKLPERVKQWPARKISLIFGGDAKAMAVWQDLRLVAQAMDRIPPATRARSLYWIRYPVEMGLGGGLMDLFAPPKNANAGMGAWASRYAIGALATFAGGETLVRIVNSPPATRWLLRSFDDAAHLSRLEKILAKSPGARRAAQQATRSMLANFARAARTATQARPAPPR